jgi:carboxymethylenebutenolidase
MPQQALTADEQRLSNLWDEHMRTEFGARRADQALETMVANPRVNQVPVMTGGGNCRLSAWKRHDRYSIGASG